VLDPGEVDFCRTLHCQRCREAEPECRAYERESGARPEACAVAVCRRCAAAEVLPRSRPLLLLRRADEHAGISAAAAVAGIAGLLALAGIVSGGALQGVLVALAALPVAFLGYL